MATIANYAEKQLRENFKEVEESTFAEFVKLESQSDPGFFRQFFNEEFNNDFDGELTEEHKKLCEDFLDSL